MDKLKNILNDLKIFLEDIEEIENEEKLKKILDEFNIIGKILNDYVKDEYTKLKDIFKKIKRIDTHFKNKFEINELILELRLREQKVIKICDKIFDIDKLVKNLRCWDYKLTLEFIKENNRISYTLIIFYNLDKFNIYMIENLLKSIINIKIFKEKIIPEFLYNVEKAINYIKKDPIFEEVFLTIMENKLNEL